MITESLAPYMTWAKRRPAAILDLASSNLMACEVRDLPGAREALELSGPNAEGFAPLLDRIANHYGVAVEQVATATGASGANFLVYAALVGAGDEVLVEQPGYDPLIGAARLLGARVQTFERRYDEGFSLQIERCASQVTPRTRLVVLTNLHNPSGVACELANLEALSDRVRARGSDAHILVDEVYLDAAVRRGCASASTLRGSFIVTSSLTKAFGLAGLRCGWIVGPPAIIERVRRARDLIDGVGAFPAEVLSALAFDHLERLRDRSRTLLGGNIALVRAFMATRRELSWVEPAGGTVCFPRVESLADAEPLVTLLRECYDTAVVPGAFFGAPRHVRVSFGGDGEVLAQGLRAIGCALDDLAAAD